MWKYLPPHWNRTSPWRSGRQVVGKVPGALRFGVPPPEGGEERGGEIDVRGRGGLHLLMEEVEARDIFPLGEGHADAGRQNPAPRMQQWVACTRVIATANFAQGGWRCV